MTDRAIYNLKLLALAGELCEFHEGGALVAVWPDDEDRPLCAVEGTASEIAGMVRYLCETVVASPRPANCASCRASWDLLDAARFALKDLRIGGKHDA